MPTEHQIVDPLTGETVTYINPWIYDASRSAWVADDVDHVTGTHFNNLLRFGQPFDPNMPKQNLRHAQVGSLLVDMGHSGASVGVSQGWRPPALKDWWMDW